MTSRRCEHPAYSFFGRDKREIVCSVYICRRICTSCSHGCLDAGRTYLCNSEYTNLYLVAYLADLDALEFMRNVDGGSSNASK